MDIDWGSLAVVGIVSLAVSIAVVVLGAFALVGLAARDRTAAPTGTGAALSPAAGTATAVLCLAATAAIIGYGLYVIVS